MSARRELTPRAYRLDPEAPEVITFLVPLVSISSWPSQPISIEELKSKLALIAADEDSMGSATLALLELAVFAGDYAEAERRLDLILASHPEWEPGKRLRVDILTLDGHVGGAKLAISRLVNRDGSRSYLLRFLKARAAFAAEDWPVAATLFQRVIHDSRASLSIRMRAELSLAACYQETGRLIREHQVCRDVLATNPASLTAVFRLAESYIRLDILEEALNQYRRFPDDRDASAAIAEILLEQNRCRPRARQRWDQVATAVEAAAQLQPDRWKRSCCGPSF